MSGFSDDAFARLDGRRLLRIGFGCYRVDDGHPAHHLALAHALRSGVNLVDTSANYGDGHSETLVGQVLKETRAEAKVDAFVVTKAGYVQGSNLKEAARREKEGRPWSGLVRLKPGLSHALGPDFLRDQLSASLARLGRERVEAFLLHNPEYHLEAALKQDVPLEEAREHFYATLRAAFALCEEECDAGRIGMYGVSSNTFVLPRGEKQAVDLTRVLAAAGPRLRIVQLPMNPLETGARDAPHAADGRSVLDVARERGLFVLVNRPLNAFAGGKLVRFAAIVPPVPHETAAGDPFTALSSLEGEFTDRWGSKISVEGTGGHAGDLLRVSPLLGEMQRGAGDLLTFAALWERHVAPRVDEVLPQLAAMLKGRPGFADWRRRFEAALRQAASAATEPFAEAEARRSAELRTRGAEALGPQPGTLAQATLRGVLAVPGVSCVLVGMRRAAYVNDALGALSEKS